MTSDPRFEASETAVTPHKASGGGEQTAQQSPQAGESTRVRSEAPSPTPASHFPPTAAMSSSEELLFKARSAAGLHVPGYRLIRELGRGTYGEVWLAEDTNTGVQVAIKFLTTSLGQQWRLLQAEVKQLAMLHDDPGIVQLKDFDPDAPRPYYVMAYAENGSLAERLKQGPISVSEALPIFRRIAEALAYVHAKGIRHCDLKPGNILLDKRGRPRVADFGQAHLASDLSPALGTFFYMAPEQADLAAQVPDTRWDVYGLGALFYAMLTGGPPHENSTLKQELARTEELPHRLRLYRETMQRAKSLTGHRRVPGVDSQLAAIVERCLAAEPARRFPTAESIVAALDHRQRSRRQKAVLYAGLAVPILLLAILGGLGFWKAQDALRQSEQNLEAQAKESHKVSARLAAEKVRTSMVDYAVALNDEVQRPEYTKALQEPDAHTKKQPELQTRLKAFKASLGGHEEAVTHCVLFDAKGFLVSVYPHEEGLIQSFAWRGYFNGGIDDWKAKRTDGGLPLDANKQAYKPIRSMHLSHPFASVGREGKLAVGLSTPVLNGQEEVMGVMLVMLNLHDLHSWLMEIEIPGGFPVLVDDEYHVLLHESAKDNLPELGANPKTYRDSNLYRAVFDKAKTRPATGGADDFTDPVDKEKYLVGYVPIEFKDPTAKVNLRKRWGVLVQVNHAKVIEPAVTLKNEMVHWGGMMLGVALLLVLALWLGLVWLLRREERLAHG